MPRPGAGERSLRTGAGALLLIHRPLKHRVYSWEYVRRRNGHSSRWHSQADCRVAAGRVSRPDEEGMVGQNDHDNDRRHFLKCMAWVGTGAAWTLSGGVLKGFPLG